VNEPSRERPRLLPDVPLPPYTYVPGQTPHPRSDPAGHLYGQAPEQPAPLDPQHWHSCRTYLRGVDLFNAGYFWEAHEVWESLWHAAGRRGTTADFLKGLIKLAAAGVKLRAGVPAGVRSHASRAAAIFHQLAGKLGGTEVRYLGLRLAELLSITQELEDRTQQVDLDRNFISELHLA
jgi:predicted metal-dependent hydrolase